MRLNAWLARAGVASRRGADELIKAGRVTVNGEPGRLNTFVAAHDRVELDGEPLAKQRLAYVLLHKPAGVVTTARDPQGRPTVVGLVDHPARVVPVGRLDADTTGVLLLTNDGELAHRLAHPRYEVDKVYVAEVEGEPDDDALRPLEQGVELEDGRTVPARPAASAPARVELTMHEGRKHQVKRMLAAVGHPVRRLHRVRFGPLTVDGLDPGEWRELDPEEVAALRPARARRGRRGRRRRPGLGGATVGADAEVAQQTVVEAVDQSVDGEILAARPGVLDDRRLADVPDLLDHVELAEAVEAAVVRERRQLAGVLLLDVDHVA